MAKSKEKKKFKSEATFYKYTAINRHKKKVKGETVSRDRESCIKQLADKGYRNIKVTKNESKLNDIADIQLGKVLKDDDLVFFLVQLSTLVKGGIKSDEALEIIALQQEKRVLKKMFYTIYLEVVSGSSISEALERMGTQYFPLFLTKMLAVGEATSSLVEVCTHLADFYSKKSKFGSSIKTALMMPIFYILATFVVGIFLIVTLIPEFKEQFEEAGEELPASTQLLILISDFLIDYWYLFVFGILSTIIFFALAFKKSDKFRAGFDKFALKAPVIGSIVQFSQLATLSSTLNHLFNSAIKSQEALSLTEATVTNNVYKEIVSEARVNVNRGLTIGIAFEDHWAIEPVVSKMISVGEKTGELPLMLKNLATYYDDNYDRQVEMFKKTLEPVLMLFVYVIMGFIIISIMIPLVTSSATMSSGM